MEAVSREVALSGARLHCELAGARDGAPVVFIHGFGVDARVFDDQAVFLAGRGFRALRYDRRGFGRSSLPRAGEEYSHAEDLERMISSFEVGPAHVVGQSLGAAVALEFAIARPGQVKSLTLIAPALRSPGPVELRKVDIDDARSALLQSPAFAPALEKPTAARRLAAMVSDYPGWHWANADPERAPPPLPLPDIKAPALVLAGERDLPRHRDTAERLARELPDARLLVLPQCGHFPTVEAPGAVNTALLGFLRR